MRRWTAEQRATAVDGILSLAPVLPVLEITRLRDAVPLGAALRAGGLPVLEITLRSTVALDAIRRIASELPEIVVGAGTVLTGDDLEAAIAAGARFAIAPGATEKLYAAAAEAAIPLIPAICTPSELMRGLEHGHRWFKYFPAAAAGGVAALRSLAGPFPSARFCPTGGIDAQSAPDYLALANVVTVGGSWMAPRDAVTAGDWDRITGLARACVALRGWSR